MRTAALLACPLSLALPRLAAQVNVTAYDLRVELRGDQLAVATTIEATGTPPQEWQLELAPQMRVTSVTAGGKPVPYKVRDGALLLAAAGIADGPGIRVAIRCEGAPSERFSQQRGGFVRTAITPELAYVRSQVAWHPRVADDPARYRIAVDAPAGWQVRTAGSFGKPALANGRSVWTFATATPIDRAGLAAGPWQLVSVGAFDALVTAAHAKAAPAVLAEAKAAFEFHAADLGAPRQGRFALVEMPDSFGTGSGYGECGYVLLGPGAFDAGPGAAWVTGFLAHETAHQWWGHDALFADFASEMLAEYSSLRCLRMSGGAEAAARAQRAARKRLGKVVDGGKAIALSAIEGFGARLDPAVYRAHAYDKGMLLLAAVADRQGEPAMQEFLRRFLAAARSRRAGCAELLRALVELGPAAAAVVEEWQRPGLPGGVPAPTQAELEARAALERGMKVANSPGEAEAKVLRPALDELRRARAAAELDDGEQAAAQAGIGRCLFRLGQLDEAGPALQAALELGAGGPFHRGWVQLRLGNLADLQGRRDDALAHYRAVLANPGASKSTLARAKAGIERAYRGFAADG